MARSSSRRASVWLADACAPCAAATYAGMARVASAGQVVVLGHDGQVPGRAGRRLEELCDPAVRGQAGFEHLGLVCRVAHEDVAEPVAGPAGVAPTR